MKLSARNQIKGTILTIRKGATMAHVVVLSAPVLIASTIKIAITKSD